MVEVRAEDDVPRNFGGQGRKKILSFSPCGYVVPNLLIQFLSALRVWLVVQCGLPLQDRGLHRVPAVTHKMADRMTVSILSF